MAHTYYGTRYLGTDGWWNGANSLIASARGVDTGTKAGPNGGFTRRIDHRIGPLYRGTAWLGVGLRADQIA